MQKFIFFVFFILTAASICCESKKNEKKKRIKAGVEKNIIKKRENKILIEKPEIILNDKNAISFFYEFNKQNNFNKVKISTSFGEIVIRLFDETPYHKSNFIYLSKLGYFNNTYFHRVVPGFIIQGGNSDNKETSFKRRMIGKYLLPVDAKNSLKHERALYLCQVVILTIHIN